MRFVTGVVLVGPATRKKTVLPEPEKTLASRPSVSSAKKRSLKRNTKACGQLVNLPLVADTKFDECGDSLKKEKK